MDMKRNKLIGLLSLCLLAATFASCEDWNETEAVKQKVERPEDQNPELWAEYTAALRDYKQSEHFIVYARLFNSPQPGTSEKDFMRCLPARYRVADQCRQLLEVRCGRYAGYA